MKSYRSDAHHVVELTLNGRKVRAQATSRMLLSDFLRHVLGATGVHVGCEHGVCGACTVQVDGVASRSCLMLALQADGRVIETVEGLNRDCTVELTDLQQAFKDHHALQCGFCTAGILMSSDAYLRQVPCPDEAQLRDMLSGHLCRCTGYTNIVQALEAVVVQRNRTKEEGDENVRSGS